VIVGIVAAETVSVAAAGKTVEGTVEATPAADEGPDWTAGTRLCALAIAQLEGTVTSRTLGGRRASRAA
jgi:hypothetical protein